MTTSPYDLQTVTSAYGKAAKAKLAAAAVSGQPEDQLRSPVEQYLKALGSAAGVKPADVVLVGELLIPAARTWVMKAWRNECGVVWSAEARPAP